MENMQTVELIIDSTDENVVGNIEQQLSGLNVIKGRTARVIDPVTALAIAAGTVKLVTELVNLWQKLRQKPDAPTVTLRNTKGESIVLSDVSAEQLRAFLEAGSTGD